MSILTWDGSNIAELFEFLAPEQPRYIPGFSNSDEIFQLPDGQVVRLGETVERNGYRYTITRKRAAA